MTVGERLRNTRIDNDHLQKDTAKLLKCSTKQIGRYENNESEMTISKLILFCKKYNVSADYILGLNPGLSWPRYEKEDA